MSLPEQQHRDDVKYASEVLSDVTLPEGWTRTWTDEGWKVEGPCPVCLGLAYSHPLQQPQQELHLEFSRSFEEHAVLAVCHCDNDHGHAGATGCGRRFLVPVPEGRSR